MRTFPALAAEIFDWFSIGWEPIAMSGERICAFVVVTRRGAPSEYAVHRCITPKQLRCLIGEVADNALALLDFAEATLTEYMRIPNKDMTPSVPFSGFVDLQRGSVFAGSLLEASHAAVRQASLLGSGSMIEFSESLLAAVEEQVEIAEQQTEDRFYQLVHRQVIERLPKLEAMFRRSFRLTDTARPTRIDFAGRTLVANLHRLKPGRSLTQQLKYGKQKLLDLSSLRLWLQEQAITEPPSQEFELIAHRPVDDAADYSSTDIKQVSEAVDELTYAADHHKLRLRLVSDVQEAANRILEVESR
jgi:hypothetical protein